MIEFHVSHFPSTDSDVCDRPVAISTPYACPIVFDIYICTYSSRALFQNIIFELGIGIGNTISELALIAFWKRAIAPEGGTINLSILLKPTPFK